MQNEKAQKELAQIIYDYMKDSGFYLGGGPCKNWDAEIDGEFILNDSEISDCRKVAVDGQLDFKELTHLLVNYFYKDG